MSVRSVPLSMTEGGETMSDEFKGVVVAILMVAENTFTIQSKHDTPREARKWIEEDGGEGIYVIFRWIETNIRVETETREVRCVSGGIRHNERKPRVDAK